MDNKTPDNKQEFKWTDELLIELVTTHPNLWSLPFKGIKKCCDDFKKSKEHKVEEKRTLVSHFRKHDTFLGNHSDS